MSLGLGSAKTHEVYPVPSNIRGSSVYRELVAAVSGAGASATTFNSQASMLGNPVGCTVKAAGLAVGVRWAQKVFPRGHEACDIRGASWCTPYKAEDDEVTMGESSRGLTVDCCPCRSTSGAQGLGSCK